MLGILLPATFLGGMVCRPEESKYCMTGRKRLGSLVPEESMLYIVIERFKNREAISVYRRFREKGRMMPEVSST